MSSNNETPLQQMHEAIDKKQQKSKLCGEEGKSCTFQKDCPRMSSSCDANSGGGRGHLNELIRRCQRCAAAVGAEQCYNFA
jgi:hypothetical protein